MPPSNDNPPLSIPPLQSGGVMLTYRCSNTCRHCAYRCSPQAAGDWMTDDTARKVFSALAAEPSLSGIHLAGGEATLRMDLLERYLRLARQAGIGIDYLETNGVWCTSQDKALEGFRRLRDAGLPAVLISASMYHNEFIPFERTQWCVQAAEEVLGRGVIVWPPNLFRLMARLPDADKTRTLEEFQALTGIADAPATLIDLFQLTPHGRVTEALRDCYAKRPAESFRGDNCRATLRSTGHFHVDPDGNLFTGHCPGIVAATADDFHPAITPATHPVFCTLAQGGPYALMQHAPRYRPREDGYISKCDLCLHVRMHLRGAGAWRELRPDGFYGE